MKKLKLFFALFAMLALGVGNAWGETIEFDLTTKDQLTTQTANSVVFTNEGATLTITKSSSGTAVNNYMPDGSTNASHTRVYKTNPITFDAGTGNKIQSITVKVTSSSGDIDKITNGTWNPTVTNSGTSSPITYTLSTTSQTASVTPSGTSRIEKVILTYVSEGGSTPEPEPDPDPTPDPEPEPEPGTGGETLSYTWNLSKKTYSAASNQVTWSATDVNMVVDKGTSGTAPNNYLGGDANNRTSSRFYQNSILTITPEANVTITSVVFTATSDSYATALKNSAWTNATATASSKTVTVTPTNGTSAISAKIGATCGFTGVTVNYTKAASGEPEPVIVKTLKSIAVAGMTTTFEQGDVFKFDGTCTATYSVTKDGVAQADQTAEVTPTSVSEPNMNTIGKQTVTVTYSEGEVDKTDEYEITIEEAPTYNFTKIEGFDDWGSSYIEHIVEYADAKVTFASADKNGSTITDQPVTKGGDVSLVLTDGMNIATVKWVCTQWTTKAQTITLHYSKDGGNVYTSTEITSSDFTISSDNLPAGTNAVKITFSSTNQVGIKSCTITKVEAAAITQVPAPQFSLPTGAYDGAQSVELTCTMADATIYYTTDGNTPTTSSAVYSTAIQVAENMTIKAYAVKEGLEDSPVAEATYEISAPADVVLDFTTNDTWNFPTEKTVTATDYSNGDYTVTVAGSEGQGFMFDNTNKNLMIGKEGSYIMLPIFNKPIVKIVCEGHSSGSGSVAFNVFVDDEAVSTQVTSCKVDQTFLIAEDKQVANVAHVIKVTNANNLRIAKIKIYLGEAPAVERPVIGGEEEFAVSTEVSITCATSGAKIYYTTDGTEPTNANAEYTAPFELSATTTVKAIAYNSTTAKSSAVTEKTFTKTIIPTKTVAEFIAAEGGRCYLEGIVSGLTEGNSMKYGNFDLTDASGTIYVYGCLNAAGESKKFAELGVKNGDKIKVIADEYELYNGTTEEAKNVQYVSHVSAASITIADITMEVGETKTIAATVVPAEAEVTYTIKENAANAISLSGNTITANAVGTATITATVAEGADYLANSVDFTVTVGPKSEKTNVVILAQYNGDWYALVAAKGSANNTLGAVEVTYVNGVILDFVGDKASITWERAIVGNKATFKNGTNYMKGATGDTDLTLETSAFEWDVVDGKYLSDANKRTFLFQGSYFKNYAISNAGKTTNGTTYSAMPVVTAVEFMKSVVTPSVEKGIFSVGEGEFVQFSAGNLQYNVGTNTWSFAENQYDYVGEANINVGNPNYEGKIDMFGWSADGKFGVNPSNKNEDYYGTFQDWGTLVNEEDWYTLSADEWKYLLNTRANAANLKQIAKVDGVVGIMLFPDAWTMPADVNVAAAYDDYFKVNIYNYTLEQWAKLEAAGAVFLPAAGRRTGGWGNTTISPHMVGVIGLDSDGHYKHYDNGNIYCYYWTSTINESTKDVSYLHNIQALGGDEYTIGTGAVWGEKGRYGQSVRLVKAIEPDYKREVRPGYYGTICLENGGQMIGASRFELSYYNEAQGLLYMDESDATMVAGNPYIFLPNEGADTLYVFYDETTAAAKTVNGLVGSYTKEELAVDATNPNYILKDNKIKKVVGTGVSVGANKAYIKLGDVDKNEPALVPGRRRVAIGQAPQVATGMESVDASAQPVKMIIDGQLYILRGEKMYDAQGKLVK